MIKKPFLHLFFSPDGRLHCGWRLAGQYTLLLMLQAGLGLILLAVKPGVSLPSFVTGELATLVMITVSVYLARRWLDRRMFASLGLKTTRQALLDLLAGFFIAGIAMGAIFLIEYSLGWMIWKRPPWLPYGEHDWWYIRRPGEILRGILPWLGVYGMVAWQEELLSRGYQLQNLVEGTGLRWGAGLSALIFAIGHWHNPGFNWQAVLGLTAIGLFFVLGKLRSGQLWLPMGLHAGWNFFEGPVFGFHVSGAQPYSLLTYRLSAPIVITGGDFGPEAGLILIPALVLGAGLVWIYTHRRGFIV